MPRNTESNHKRQALLVLGMHRSGTSALSGVLASLGAQPPRNLLPQAKDNEKGFWESAELVKFHDRILASSGSRWNDWEEFNPDWVDSVVAEQFMELLPPLIEQEFGDARLLLLKDPRMCRFVPFWLKALERLGITPRVVVPLRRPSEVARSLQVRNGFGSSRAMLMWLRHVLDVELNTRKVARSFIRYDGLLDDWRGQVKKIGNELDVKWPRWSSLVEIEIDDYLSSELRHHKHGDEVAGVDRELLGWITRTNQALGQLVDGSGQQADAYAVLDEVRLALGRSSAIYATVVREHEIKADGDVAKFKHELEAKSKECAETVARLSTLVAAHEGALETLTQANASQARELLTREADAAMLNVTRAEEKQAHAAAMADHEQLLQARGTELDSLRVEAQQSIQVANQRELELAKCKTELETVRTSEKQLVEFRSQADTRLAEVKAIVTQLAAENAALNVRSSEQAKSLEERYTEIVKLTKLLIAKEREAEARFMEYRTVADQKIGLEAELKKLHAELALMRRSWFWRVGSPIRHAGKMLRGMRPAGKISAEARMLKESGWLDATWYADRYPDVAESGIDPAVHYLEFGALEGRDPGPRFDTNFYVRTYADVAASGINPLLHFIQHGQGENRKPR